VNVRRGGGFYFLNRILGRQPIIGVLDLNKEREVTVDEAHFIQISVGNPSSFIVLPDTFEQLPKGVKEQKLLSMLFRMYYELLQSLKAQEEFMLQSGFQRNEIMDRLSQSQTMYMESISKQIQLVRDATENAAPGRGQQPQQPQQIPQQQYY
jgi:hypothetical protein